MTRKQAKTHITNVVESLSYQGKPLISPYDAESIIMELIDQVRQEAIEGMWPDVPRQALGQEVRDGFACREQQLQKEWQK